MAVVRTPRARWIEEGLRALSQGGPAAVRIESLAKRLGVSKGGFYGHFDDRSALLEEMLDVWEHRSTAEVIEGVERKGGDAMTKGRRAAALTFSDELLTIDLAVRDWARHERPVADRLRRVDERRMDYLRSLLAESCTDEGEVEARCLIAFSVAIGNRLIDVDHGARSRAEVLDSISGWLFTP
ncbi:TetR/AcrR family transcriptional regulator [Agromyces laixinhei]|uniref:TetR/AcrR family transcriptional regulator n=1 Tax=Agromyces laixinhei TaxID=2585717 RepID=UPI001115D4B7|nr:TetR/AcrR family transcriptional regulator [Agromyces laixinhei]